MAAWFYPLYWLLQCSWGAAQTLLGAGLFLYHLKRPHHFFRGAVLTDWPCRGGISLGPFIFAADDTKMKSPQARRAMAAHEFGHTLQSLLLGPFYLPVIGLPSFLWANCPRCQNLRRQSAIPYSFLYTERWADQLAAKYAPPNAAGRV